MLCSSAAILLLTNNLLCTLVISESQKTRMPQLAFRCPFGEADLRDKFRPDPVHPAVWRVTGGKKIAHGLQLRELLAQVSQEFFIEARANLSRIHQLSPLVVSHQQCPESDAVSLRVRVPANYELLFFRHLNFNQSRVRF